MHMHSANSNIIAKPLNKPFSDKEKEPNNLTYLLTKQKENAQKAKTNFKLVLPHLLMLGAVCIYVLLGATVFHLIELPQERYLKDKGIVTVQHATQHLQNRVQQICTEHNMDLGSDWKFNFQEDILNFSRILFKENKVHYVQHSDLFGDDNQLWSFPASILFSFAIITTIGYGNIAPVTIGGRLFCMIYALIGIPMAMLAIANIGKFIAEGMIKLLYKLSTLKDTVKGLGDKNVVKLRTKEEDAEAACAYYSDTPVPLLCLLVTVMVYLCIGAIILPRWESLPFFSAIYFSFISITTTGLGDIVPERLSFLAITITYISVGVAIASMAIELTADCMRKLHYLGRKVNNARFARLHINGKTILVQDIVKSMGKKYGIPAEDLDKFVENELDEFMEETIERAANFDQSKLDQDDPIDPYTKKDPTDPGSNGILGPFSIEAPDVLYIDDERKQGQ